MNEMDGFGRRLHELRKKAGMTQEGLAEMLGVTAQAVSKWENGQSYPDITTIPTVASVLDTDIASLFGQKTEKVKEFKIKFPETHEGLPFVYSHVDVACYSDKKVASTSGSGVRFEDGSSAELYGRLAINAGQGEIRFLTVENVGKEETGEKTARYDFAIADSLEIAVNVCECKIVRSSDGKAHVSANGHARFIRQLRVSEAGGTLSVRGDDGDSLRGQRHEDNIIKIEVPFEEGRRAFLCLNDSGKIETPLNFKEGNIVVNGSGVVTAGNFQKTDATINGSGNIRFGDSKETHVNINGSGDIDMCVTEKLGVSVNGSGEVRASRAVAADVQINGSGDVEITEIDGGDLTVKVFGSGDVTVGCGKCEAFNVHITGNGDITAESVTARRADIVIEDKGSVRLGRVIERSSEQVKKNGTVFINKRGPDNI